MLQHVLLVHMEVLTALDVSENLSAKSQEFLGAVTDQHLAYAHGLGGAQLQSELEMKNNGKAERFRFPPLPRNSDIRYDSCLYSMLL